MVMKTLMGILILILSSGLTFTALASDLASYRQGNKQTSQVAEERASALKAELGLAKQTASAIKATAALRASLAKLSTPRRKTSSSTFIKELMERRATSIDQEIRLSSAKVLDPSLFDYELEKLRAVEEKRRCLKILHQPVKVGSGGFERDSRGFYTGGFSQLVEIFYSEAIGSNSSAPSSKISSPKTESDSRVLAEIQGRMTSKLGKLNELRVEDGVLQGLGFHKDAVDYFLTLQILSSFRTEQDVAFLRVQRCMMVMTKESLDTLSLRLDELNSGIADAVAKRFKGDHGLNDEEKKAYEKSLALYTDDKPDLTPAELRTRIERLGEVGRYLNGRQSQAVFIHRVLESLTRAEIDGLIGLFLDLRGSDIPVGEDILKITDPSDLKFYQTLHNSLFSLEKFIPAQREKEKQYQDEIQRIHQKAKSGVVP
jgi:hypothetical protein